MAVLDVRPMRMGMRKLRVGMFMGMRLGRARRMLMQMMHVIMTVHMSMDDCRV